jgi:hypothetical protein
VTLTFDRPGTLERPASDWVRDEDNRAMIKPDPEWNQHQVAHWMNRGGMNAAGERPYTRVTTFGEALLDGTMLAKWKLRRALVGMSRRPDYAVAAAALTVEDRDKKALNDLATKCIEAAGPNAADIGTALHGFSERIDRGEPMEFVPPGYRADLERYREVVESHLTWQHREERMVCDALEVAGTPDGIALCDQPDPDGVVDLLRIVDLKTGNIETTAGKFSCQLGIYSHSALYDPATGERTWLADLDTRWGLVLHMPAGAGTAELRWLNLEHGWLGAQIAGPVRKWRTVNHADLMRPLVPVERVVAEGMCHGVKRDGEPCGYKAKADGLCARHQGQDPDAVVPVRVQQVAAELSEAIENVPEPLRVGDPMPGTLHSTAGELDPLVQPATESTAVDPAVEPLPNGQYTSVSADGAPGDQPEDWDDENTPDPAGRDDTQLDPDPGYLENGDDLGTVLRALGYGAVLDAAMEQEAQRPDGPRELKVDDDPITWCDCQSDEQCPDGELCRRRSHLPDPRRYVNTPAAELNGNPTPSTSMPDPEAAQEAAENAEMALMDQVRACRTTGELQMLYEATGQAWTPAVKKYASRHRELLPELAQRERTSAALYVAIDYAASLAELRAIFEDPRNAPLITQAHKDAAKARAAELPPF